VLLRRELEKPGNGRVLVVDGHGSPNCAICGDMVAGLGMKNGSSGLVINGLVRDVKTLAQLDFGILARGSNPKKSRKNGIGLVGEPVDFGSIRFVSGHYIYCDVDGILVGPKQLHKS
jgi:regulator of ribonuclease activity A